MSSVLCVQRCRRAPKVVESMADQKSFKKHLENKVGTQCQTTRKFRCGACYICHITPWEKCPLSELGFLWLFHIRRCHIYKAFSGSGCLRESHFKSPSEPNYHSREYLRQGRSGRHSSQQDTAYRLYTSALRVLPMILPSRRGGRSVDIAQTEYSKMIPRCGTLLQ